VVIFIVIENNMIINNPFTIYNIYSEISHLLITELAFIKNTIKQIKNIIKYNTNKVIET
jgi:hypothetical protein